MERVTRAALATYVAGERPLSHDEQLRLAVHLSTGCTECWMTVETLPRPEPRMSSDPLMRALRRIRYPRSWPMLRAEHLRTVRSVRETEWGFARLLIEESAVLVRERSFADGGFQHLLVLADSVVQALCAAEPGNRLSGDFKARISLTHAYGEHTHLYRTAETSERAFEALRAAPRWARQGTGCRDLRLDLLLAQARFTNSPDTTTTDPTHRLRGRCLDLVEPEDHLRRLEVVKVFAECQDVLDFWRVGEPAYLRHALVQCWETLEQLLAESDDDPVARLAGLIRMADFAVTLRRLAIMKLGPRPHGIPALEIIAARLKRYLKEFTRHADFHTVARITAVIRELQCGPGALRIWTDDRRADGGCPRFPSPLVLVPGSSLPDPGKTVP